MITAKIQAYVDLRKTYGGVEGACASCEHARSRVVLRKSFDKFNPEIRYLDYNGGTTCFCALSGYVPEADPEIRIMPDPSKARLDQPGCGTWEKRHGPL